MRYYRQVAVTDNNLIRSISRTDIARGKVAGAQPFGGFGERSNIGTGTAGEDIWRGAADLVPTPPQPSGDAMSVVSSDVADAAAGTGIRTLRIHYLDSLGNPQNEDITMNGVTAVPLVDTSVRFVQRMHAMTVGSNVVAEGDITIFKTGTPATVYNQIELGGNMTLTPHRMVPLGKELIITSWHATESQNKRVAYRIRATSDNNNLFPGVFIFIDTMYLALSALDSPLLLSVPALAIVKITGWGDAVGGEASVAWFGFLFDA